MNKINGGLFILIAAALASCAGTAAVVRVDAALPEDLYGIDAYLDAADRAQEEKIPFIPVLPEPSSAAAVIRERQGEILSMVPASGAPPQGIMLPLPVVPAVNPAQTKPKAAQPAAKQPSARTSAQSSAQTKAAQPAQKPAAAQKSSPASGPGVTVNPAPAKSAVPESTTPRVREIYARISDEVEIGLEGEGYVFLGFPDKIQATGMSFKSKQARDGKTYFKFKAFALGKYDLAFQRQDNASGKIAKEEVRIHVVSDAEFATAVDQQAVLPARDAGQAEKPDLAYADSLVQLEKYDAAIAEYMKGYRESDAFMNDRVASVYSRMGDSEAAEKYFKRNLSPGGPYYERAVLGLVRSALARRDEAAFLSYLKPFLSIKELDIEDYLVQAAVFQKERGDIGVGLALMAEYIKRYPNGARWDEAYFLLAQFLEADSPYRDIARAKEIYTMILGTFPESKYASPSRERLRYIEQHFYYVR